MNASPIARRAADSLGIELGSLAGSGPYGRVLKADVLAAAAVAQAEAPPVPRVAPRAEPEPAEGARGAKGSVQVLDASRLQRTSARRMAESKATQPDFSIALDVDMGALLELREQLRGLEADTPTISDFIVRATAVTLRAHPRLNGAFRDERFELYERVNIGVAVATDNGLVVPTVFDADRLSLGAVARESRRLVQAIRSGSVAAAELEGATFTVSNLGMFGIVRFAGVINPPQAAILCVGAVEPRAVVREQQVVARPTATLTLVCDHRIVYGADAARFLSDLGKALEQPLSALL